MKSIRRFSFFKMLVLTIAAMCASSIPAHAQAATGTFSLAHRVRWASAVLPPGDYEFSLDSQDSPARITVRQVGGSIVAMILPQSSIEVAAGTTVSRQPRSTRHRKMLRLTPKSKTTT